MPDNNLEKSKEDLLAEIDRRIEDKIIEKTNADLLKKLINNADTLTEAVAIAELGTTYRRTGLHFDKRLEKFTDTIKYFKKNEDLSFKTDEKGLTHKLIIGDNYDALLNLLIEYRGRIDVIYIDPPYGKDSMGEFAETNYDNAITRDNLLSMLYPRLELAKQLLSEDGVIFCSMDDRNQAYVKCLMDEVFQEANFIANIVWKSKRGRDNSAKWFSKAHEYTIVYGKNKSMVNFSRLGLDETTRKAYKNPDNDTRGDYRMLACWARGTQGGVEYEFSTKDGYHFSKRLWLFSKENLKKLDNDDKLIRRGDNLYRKMFLTENEGKIPETLWDDTSNAANASDEIKSIFGEILFDTPKPTPYIERMLKISTRPESIVLDFFAGSGTTGQSVLNLNQQDGGKRTFILCQSDENKIGSSTAARRLKRIMTGECYDGNKDFDWIKNNEPYGDNLDVYEIETVANFESSEGKTPFDVIDETLYGKEKMNPKDKIKWVCENFDNTQKYIEKDSDYKKRIEGAE